MKTEIFDHCFMNFRRISKTFSRFMDLPQELKDEIEKNCDVGDLAAFGMSILFSPKACDLDISYSYGEGRVR